MAHFKIKRDHFTSGMAYKAGDTREMDEADAAPLVAIGVIERTDEPKGRGARKTDSAE